MDDLIPFLIVVLISIIGAATRKKKKRSFPGSIVEEEPRRREDDFMSWMERFVDDEPLQNPYVQQPVAQVEPEVEEVEPEVVEPKVEINRAFNQYSGFISPEEHERLVEREAPHETTKSIKAEAEEPIKEGEIGKAQDITDFDLRRAVIFSTILERKYD